MIKIKIKHIISGMLFLQASIVFAAQLKEKYQEPTHFFGKIAVTRVDSYGSNNFFAGHKLLIQPVTYNKDSLYPFRHRTKPLYELGKPFWVITGEQLPVNEDTCVAAKIDSCEANPTDPFDTCYHSCAKHGPKFLYYDMKKSELYIIADTTEVGQGGGGMLVFVADIHSKTIKYLRMIGGPVNAELSPSGKYMAFYGGNEITIYNLATKSDVEIIKSDVSKLSGDNLLIIKPLRWLSDTQFVYRETIYKNKFDDETVSSTEHIHHLTAHTPN